MEALRQYVLSVAAAAIVCGIVVALVQNCGAKEWIRLLCGLILAFTAIRPIAHLDLDALTEVSLPLTLEAESASAMGEEMARQALADSIKAESEAYILDKAAALNASLTVEVTVSEDGTPVPLGAKLGGSVSPYARQQLESLIQTDLGIAKENQLWTG